MIHNMVRGDAAFGTDAMVEIESVSIRLAAKGHVPSPRAST